VAAVRDALLVELALWGTDVLAIRKRPDAGRAVSGIGRAIKDAYRAIDRMRRTGSTSASALHRGRRLSATRRSGPSRARIR
jgi:hypothetical protein